MAKIPVTAEELKVKAAKDKRQARWLNPSSESPTEELRRLVQEHHALVRKGQAVQSMAMTRKNRLTGEEIPNRLPQDVKDLFNIVHDEAIRQAHDLEWVMEKVLTGQKSRGGKGVVKPGIAIYERFLSHVYGAGPVVASYIVAMTDIRKAVKPSNLRRYYGLAVIDGRLERRIANNQKWVSVEKAKERRLKALDTRISESGEKEVLVKQPLSYNADMRVRLYQMASAMKKNLAKKTAAAPYGSTSKYEKIWYDTWLREGFRAKEQGFPKNWKKKAFSKGLWKSIGVFAEDLYLIWRSIEGLEVWPDYYAAKISGREHKTGKVIVNSPRILTVDEAVAVVGDVGAIPLDAVRPSVSELVTGSVDPSDELIGEEVAAE